MNFFRAKNGMINLDTVTRIDFDQRMWPFKKMFHRLWVGDTPALVIEEDEVGFEELKKIGINK